MALLWNEVVWYPWKSDGCVVRIVPDRRQWQLKDALWDGQHLLVTTLREFCIVDLALVRVRSVFLFPLKVRFSSTEFTKPACPAMSYQPVDLYPTKIYNMAGNGHELIATHQIWLNGNTETAFHRNRNGKSLRFNGQMDWCLSATKNHGKNIPWVYMYIYIVSKLIDCKHWVKLVVQFICINTAPLSIGKANCGRPWAV